MMGLNLKDKNCERETYNMYLWNITELKITDNHFESKTKEM